MRCSEARRLSCYVHVDGIVLDPSFHYRRRRFRSQNGNVSRLMYELLADRSDKKRSKRRYNETRARLAS